MTGNRDAWRRRAASIAVLFNLVYAVVVVGGIVWAVTDMAHKMGSRETGGTESMLLFFAIGAMIVPLIIGLAIVSPVLTWLVALAVGLWRGRPWARIGGMITLALCAFAILPSAATDSAAWHHYLIAALFALPALLGLYILVIGGSAFERRADAGSARPPGGVEETGG